jgi:hypothetical protein
MTIHHATVKNAAGRGVTFAYPDGDTVEATHGQTGIRVCIDTEGFDTDTDAGKDAMATVLDMAVFVEENPAYRAAQISDMFCIVLLADEDTSYEGETWADAYQEWLEREPETDDEEAEAGGSCVPDGYKKLYQEIGIRHQDNGDFLAAVMAKYTITLLGKDEVVDVEKVEALGYANNVDYPVSGYGPSLSGTRGWQGRYRMTVGNMLRKRIADARECFLPKALTGTKPMSLTPPAEWCAKYATKPKSKKVKAEAVQAATDLAAKPKRSRKAKVAK